MSTWIILLTLPPWLDYVCRTVCRCSGMGQTRRHGLPHSRIMRLTGWAVHGRPRPCFRGAFNSQCTKTKTMERSVEHGLDKMKIRRTSSFAYGALKCYILCWQLSARPRSPCPLMKAANSSRAKITAGRQLWSGQTSASSTITVRCLRLEGRHKLPLAENRQPVRRGPGKDFLCSAFRRSVLGDRHTAPQSFHH